MANNNPNYIVTIKQVPDPQNPSVEGITVVAPMPDTFDFDAASSYEAPYSQGLFGNGPIAQLGKLAGLKLTTQAFTAQIWQGSTETALRLTLEFHTETDPNLDVRTPILNLMKLTTPSIDPSSGLLTSPGPQLNFDQFVAVGTAAIKGGINAATAAYNKLSNAKTATMTSSGTTTPKTTPGSPGQAQFWKSFLRNQVSIRIGNYAFFDSVVITDVHKTYSHQIDALTNLPLHAKVDIQFKPLFLLVQSDLDKIFIQ